MTVQKLEQLREKANKLPLLPGVYLMKDETETVIYVGKAKLLKNRVTSYFRGEHLPKVAAMVEKVHDFDVIMVGSEFEALVLENSLIKRHQPRYNILLRDDKGYPFLRLDLKEDYPRFTLVNRMAEDGAQYFGPYGGRSMTHDILDTVLKTLRLPSCSRVFPRDIGKDRPCLNHHMGTCAGYCLKDASREDYLEGIRQARMILSGKTGDLTAQLQTKMEEAAEALRFELAAEYRDRIRAIAGLKNRQHVIGAAGADTDAVAFHRGAKCCFTVLHYVDGDLVHKDYEIMDEPLEEDGEILSALIRQYYLRRGVAPRVILLERDLEDKDALEQMLRDQCGRKVSLERPQRGDRVRLLEQAVANAREEVLRVTTAAQRQSKVLSWLQRTLELPAFPERIEAFDISNFGSDGIVAAMTVFEDGKPRKKDYRRFRIQTTDGPDDYASMREAVQRRYQRMLDGDEKFADKPNLLLIDGGIVHAATARNTLYAMGVTDIPVFGMVKDDRHHTRALVSPEGKEIGISGNPAVFALIGTIQDETHRFAIEYNKLLRNETMKSELDNIRGVGEKRRSQLLQAFKSVGAIRKADLAELAAVVPKNTALAVYSHFHSENENKGDVYK